MQDNRHYFLSLHAYLNRADQHYTEGRFLWKSHAIDGACNLLWLAIEQMIKLFIIQSRLEGNRLEDVEIKVNGQKQTLNYDPQESDIRKIHKVLDSTSYNINSKHKLSKLLEILTEETGIDLTRFHDALKKVKKYYDRRYYIDESTSIRIDQLDTVDEIYFYLRANVTEKIVRALIDEISFQRKFNIRHPLPYFMFAYRDNTFFSHRKHPVVYVQFPDGRFVKNDGDADEFISSVPSGMPVHPSAGPQSQQSLY